MGAKRPKSLVYHISRNVKLKVGKFIFRIFLSSRKEIDLEKTNFGETSPGIF